MWLVLTTPQLQLISGIHPGIQVLFDVPCTSCIINLPHWIKARQKTDCFGNQIKPITNIALQPTEIETVQKCHLFQVCSIFLNQLNDNVSDKWQQSFLFFKQGCILQIGENFPLTNLS